MRFDPERMAVYRLAREHTRAVEKLLAQANTRGFGRLVTQLRDSTASVPANILEGKGEWRRGKQANYLMIAKGSLLESWSHTDSLLDFGLLHDACKEYEAVRDLQNPIVALLITMIRRLEEHAGKENPIPSRSEI